ncbi:MAG: Type secretion system domain, type pilus assembly protein PilC [Candidatus Taylorbacteria bacterium]|nr:Type secretion system domain, type pilus assembly protein PilC [Candidatus Taylorbacteria bacterium]
MLFNYKALDAQGQEQSGSVEALNNDVAISSIQRRGLVITQINSVEEKKGLSMKIKWLERVSNKDVVILSRQIATLFAAQVSALRVFRLLGGETENKVLGEKISEVADDIQAGASISKALSKHPKVFSTFYVNMVKAGEESGKLDQTFMYLADYLDRNYAVSSKAKNALIYPAFVVFTFISVMVLMLTLVIPKISAIITESGQQIPIYTRIVIGFSNFLVNYGILFLIAIVILGFFIYRSSLGEKGALMMDSAKLSVPYVGTLYKKLYLSRIADNMNTLLVSGIPMIKALELTSDVVDSKVYQEVLKKAMDLVKGGRPLSEALSGNSEIPSIVVQMAKIGEETGELGSILDTLAKFYQREVVNAVDTLVDLIEPVMIVLLGLGVAFLLASVLIPIYNISASI